MREALHQYGTKNLGASRPDPNYLKDMEELLIAHYNPPRNVVPKNACMRIADPLIITKVLFNGPATIVWFNNDHKVVVKLNEGETDDREKAILLAHFRESQGLTKTGCSKLLRKLVSAK